MGMTIDLRVVIGRNFARIRREKGLTQEQVSERSGLSQQYLSGLEKGVRNPTIVTISTLSDALGVGYLELLRASGEPEN